MSFFVVLCKLVQDARNKQSYGCIGRSRPSAWQIFVRIAVEPREHPIAGQHTKIRTVSETACLLASGYFKILGKRGRKVNVIAAFSLF